MLWDNIIMLFLDLTMGINKNVVKLTEIVITVAVGLVALRGSTTNRIVSDVEVNTNKGKSPSPISGAQLMREDVPQHMNSCSSDADCNPNSANPLRFTRRCDMSSYSIDEGGNQGGVCKNK